MTEILVAVLASSAFAALINQVGNALQWKRQRAAAQEDGVDQRIKNLEQGMMAVLLDRIQYLCKCYIKDGAVDVDDLRRLHIMHERYHELGGNGDLDQLLDAVNHLPLK